METMHNELKNAERENRILDEKLRHITSELGLSTDKTVKYKKIAKTFKSKLESIEQTFNNLKKLSQ